VTPSPLYAGLVVALALALDLAVGDPPDRLHPVAWMGRALDAGRRLLCRGRPPALLLGGTALTLSVMALAAGGGAVIASAAAAIGMGGLVLEAIALKSTLSPRGLARAARTVAAALSRGDLDAGRARLGRDLVSRPTATLSVDEVASGAIESVAENVTDAVLAPIVFYLALGLPGALAYRALNTADTMLGYRQGKLEHFGKVAARLDDVANLLPARLAALALVVAAGRRAPSAWATMIRDRHRTASPNAGWTMSAMAGALGRVLAKPGAYRLGQGGLPTVADVETSIRIAARAVVLGVLTSVAVAASIRAFYQ
jgi:adenosylcobinamide-phosphate synthase